MLVWAAHAGSAGLGPVARPVLRTCSRIVTAGEFVDEAMLGERSR
jgi:hypothetical protein